MGWSDWSSKLRELWEGLPSFPGSVSYLLGLDQLKKNAVRGLQIVLLFAGSISSFFVGLFLSVGGLDYLLLIDKRSMLASLFMYTAILSSFTMIVTFVPQLVRKGLFVRPAQALGLVGFSIYIIGLEYTVLLAAPAGCILLWVRLKYGRKGPQSEELRGHLLKVGASAAVLLLRLRLPAGRTFARAAAVHGRAPGRSGADARARDSDHVVRPGRACVPASLPGATVLSLEPHLVDGLRA